MHEAPPEVKAIPRALPCSATHGHLFAHKARPLAVLVTERDYLRSVLKEAKLYPTPASFR